MIILALVLVAGLPDLQTIQFAGMEGGHELRERDKAVLVAVVLLQDPVHNLLCSPEPLPLRRLSVLGRVVPGVALGDVLLGLVMVIVVMTQSFEKL